MEGQREGKKGGLIVKEGLTSSPVSPILAAKREGRERGRGGGTVAYSILNFVHKSSRKSHGGRGEGSSKKMIPCHHDSFERRKEKKKGEKGKSSFVPAHESFAWGKGGKGALQNNSFQIGFKISFCFFLKKKKREKGEEGKKGGDDQPFMMSCISQSLPIRNFPHKKEGEKGRPQNGSSRSPCSSPLALVGRERGGQHHRRPDRSTPGGRKKSGTVWNFHRVWIVGGSKGKRKK